MFAGCRGTGSQQKVPLVIPGPPHCHPSSSPTLEPFFSSLFDSGHVAFLRPGAVGPGRGAPWWGTPGGTSGDTHPCQPWRTLGHTRLQPKEKAWGRNHLYQLCFRCRCLSPHAKIWMQIPPHLVTHHTACPKPDLSPGGVSRLPAAVQLPRNHPRPHTGPVPSYRLL